MFYLLLKHTQKEKTSNPDRIRALLKKQNKKLKYQGQARRDRPVIIHQNKYSADASAVGGFEWAESAHFQLSEEQPCTGVIKEMEVVGGEGMDVKDRLSSPWCFWLGFAPGCRCLPGSSGLHLISSVQLKRKAEMLQYGGCNRSVI